MKGQLHLLNEIQNDNDAGNIRKFYSKFYIGLIGEASKDLILER